MLEFVIGFLSGIFLVLCLIVRWVYKNDVEKDYEDEGTRP